MEHPPPLLSVVVQQITDEQHELSLCAGFERGQWRSDALAQHMMDWLPEFVLPWDELQKLSPANAMRMTRRAAQLMYDTKEHTRRGEFGELLLHIVLRQEFGTVPAISKIYYKSAVNKTVEGFDAVHVVATEDALELWIGETKFYKRLDLAIKSVSEEIVDHLGTDYLRNEFLLITNKVSPEWPHADRLKRLLDSNTSLDEVFDAACIPVLLTYESTAARKADRRDDAYLGALKAEFLKGLDDFRAELAGRSNDAFGGPLPVRVHVFLVPLDSKKTLIDTLDRKLKGRQA